MNGFNHNRFEDQVAIVTGGAQGIGEAVSRRLGHEGARVFIADFNPDVGNETARDLQDKGIDATYTFADISRVDDIRVMVGQVASMTNGQIDVLINNAGITRDKSALGTTEDMWDAVLDTHAKGTMFTSQEVAKLMVQRKRGSIVNAASVVAEYGNKGQSNYVAAKMAIIGLTKTHSKEWASKGIRVNAVAPGFIDTPMVAGMTIEAVENTKKLIPLGRLGNPDEIANAYAFLASDEASYVTGAVLHVDGGTILPWTQ